MFIVTVLQRFAASCDPAGTSFFKLTPWYAYLDGETDALGKCVPVVFIRDESGRVVSSNIWLIVLAVIDSLIKIAALVAVGFVIYGGIQFMLSHGEPDKTNEARNTIINALVGLVIAMIAASIVSFIGSRFT